MHISDILAARCPSISFEFFPPKSDIAAEELRRSILQVRPLAPSFISVTYGAGGSTRERTRELVIQLHKEGWVTIVPHLTCVGHTRREIAEILTSYVSAGIQNVLALRGDLPAGSHFDCATQGEFHYASELVDFIRREFPGLGIGVAGYPEGHPETIDRLLDIENLKRKIDAGADHVITQLFFENRDFFDFCERCELAGIRAPIIAGIMPIQSISGARRMAGMCGARIPAPLLRALRRAQDDPDSVARVGAHWATEQCRDLLDHKVKGIHLFTLNRSGATRRIYESLGVQNTAALQI